MTSWPSEFQHLLAARHKSFGIYTCQNVLVEPSNLIEPSLQGLDNQTAVCRANPWCVRTIPIGLKAVLNATQHACIADVTQQSTMQMPDAGRYAQLLYFNPSNCSTPATMYSDTCRSEFSAHTHLLWQTHTDLRSQVPQTHLMLNCELTKCSCTPPCPAWF